MNLSSYYENDAILSLGEYAKGVGRMFYLVSPKDHLYEDVDSVPNIYVQSWPYFLMFMILEHIILKLEGKKGIRLNDGITSISNGLFLEGGRLIWRGAEAYLYTWVYTHYRLIDLPWNHTATWFLAALGVDFCYYWMHRACHEIHILWAQHQVHHTSEDFNMGVGIRQSILQGWCGFTADNTLSFNYICQLMYVPLALAIPPAQFVLHHQFSYLYMFWIHTESVKTLGPLELRNTVVLQGFQIITVGDIDIQSSVPFNSIIGSNPYCIDVNYGGVLIIWDKLFGTFRPEKEGDRIVYGLIYNQPSFNPLHLQTFYTGYVVSRFHSYNNWEHKLRAVFSRPSWKPENAIRFKDMAEDPAIHTRIKYDVILPRWCSVYLLTHYALVLFGFHHLFTIHSMMPPFTVLVLTLYILGSLTVFGMILDASPRAPAYELTRCSLIIILGYFLNPAYGVINAPLQLFYLTSGLFWFIFVYKTEEIKSVKQGI
ncbi:unnamed protein product [Diatraea saccharalis]|uniref:Alkylglycerol monooxygenase n=1 Tax=Diatraea saccharalis TaxID=40085 RepID=A0A9N9RFU6_9NEOP|nr:unnamed protein product [Diatraea saccharalis]